MRAGLFFLIPIVGIAMLVSWLLIPREAEIGLMQLKGRDYSDAQRQFEKLYEAGDHSVSIAMPLADIYLYKGQVRDALTVLEAFVEASPENVQALEKLALVQEQARDYRGYLRTLERLHATAPKPELARLLADLHGYRGSMVTRADYLDEVVQGELAESEDFVELALFRADEQRFAEALDVLADLWRRNPDAFEGGVPDIYTQIALDSGADDRLRRDALAALRTGWRASVANEIVSALLARERYGLVVELLRPFEAPVQQNAALLQNLTLAELQTGAGDAAYARLLALYRTEVLPEGALDSLVQLAVERSDLDLAIEAGERRPVDRLPEELLVYLVEALVEARRGDLLDRLAGDFDPDRLAERPLLAAELALARGRPVEAADWRDRAHADGYGLTATNLVRLARLDVRLGRMAEAREHLQRIENLRDIPVPTFSQLVRLYGLLGEEARGVSLFRRLIAANGHRQAIAGWARLATVAAPEQELMNWLGATEAIERELLLDLSGIALGASRPVLARAYAERAHAQAPEAGSRRALADALLQTGEAADVVALLTPHLQEASPAETGLYVEALIETGKGSTALAHLDRLYEDGELGDQLLGRYVELALAADRLGLAQQVARERAVHQIAPGAFVALIARIFDSGRRDEAQHLIEQIGEAALAREPLLAARIAFARDHRDEVARWLEQAQQRDNPSFEEELEVARLQQAIGLDRPALERLERLAENPRMPPAVLGDLSRLYAEIGDAKRGYRLFARLREANPSGAADAAWARLAAAAGRTRDVTAWLKRQPEPDRQLLLDLFYAGQAASRTSLMQAAASRLAALYPGDEAQRLQAEAALAAGRPAAAAKALAPLLGRDEAIDATYLAALEQAGDWPAVTREVRRRLGGETGNPATRILLAGLLANPKVEPGTVSKAFLRRLVNDLEKNRVRGREADGHIAALVRYAPKAALPFLDGLAKGDDPERLAAYEAALEQGGDRERLRRHLRRRAAKPTLDRAARRAIVFRLIDLGDKEGAEAVLKELASEQAADGEDSRQLLFLWGPRPGKIALDWIAQRAVQGSASRRAGWLRVLNDANAYDRVLSIAAKQPPAEMAPPIWQAYLRALRGRGDRTLLQAALLARVFAADDAGTLRSLAALADREGAEQASRAAWGRILERDDEDAEALRVLARRSYFDGRLREAKSLYERYFERLESVPEGPAGKDRHAAWYRYGEVLAGLAERASARQAYRKAETLLPAVAERSLEDHRIAAYLHYRQGRTRAALAGFEDLLARDPDNRDLRADYANLLIDLGFLDRARAILGGLGGQGNAG